MKLIFWILFWAAVGAFLHPVSAFGAVALYVLFINCYAWVTRGEDPR